MAQHRITFEGFLMDMAEGGIKDSEGSFTVASARSAEQLKEQFAGDPLLAYTELLQGLRELGASEVRITPQPPSTVEIAASFCGAGPDLAPLLNDPLRILDAPHALYSGTGLLLLQHGRDTLYWSRMAEGEATHWQFNAAESVFERMLHVPWSLRFRRNAAKNSTVWRLKLSSARPLALFPDDSSRCWRRTPVAREFVDRMAFYGVPTICAGQPMQAPIPGRLVPTDFYRRHEAGPMGYNWEPLAFELLAAPPGSSMSFLSEPFTGTVASVVSVDGQVSSGFGLDSFPNYVSFKGIEQRRNSCNVPFRRRRFFGSSKLTTPGFQSFPAALINARMEAGFLQAHSWGRPLLCSRLIMLSTALGGPSTVIFLRHGAVLGGRHEDLGIPGTLALVGVEGLSTDLSRRNVRRDSAYQQSLEILRKDCLSFAEETATNLADAHWARKVLRDQLSRVC